MDCGSVEQRRARLVGRHLLDGSGSSAAGAARAVVALHASDPASVYLSALARARDLSLDDVATEMYDDRSLVRLMAMRRTLFVVPLERAPVVHHAVSLDVAATIRKRLVQQLRTLPTDPPLPDDPEALDAWLRDVEAGVTRAAQELGSASGAQLGRAEPRMRTAILPSTDKAYDVRRTVTTQILTLMGADGHLVRSRPMGSWTSRQHTWEPATNVWPDGIPEIGRDEARDRLVEDYLRAFGPVTEADIAWWTGWSLGVTRKALARLETAEVQSGLVMADDTGPVAVPEPSAALLPALDPTPMGWKERDWFLPADRTSLYDRMGNIGPTIWWAGEVVGAWATRPDGSIATQLLCDRGQEARRAVAGVAEQLHERLDDAVVTPSFPTPLAKQLASS